MNSGDGIFLEGVEVFAYGGVTEAERAMGQRYSLDIRVEFDLDPAGHSDDVADTISYADLHALAVQVMRAGTFRLIESRAATLAEAILARTPAISVSVRIRKLAPPIDGVVHAAGVEIARRRDSVESAG